MPFAVVVLAALAAILLTVAVSPWWLIAALPFGALALLGCWDLAQRRHSVLRNYPLLGHMRYMLEKLRPEIQQYFIERDFDGSPFNRNQRSLIYERAKGVNAEEPFGSELDVYGPGHEWFTHSIAAQDPPAEQPRVRLGGSDCPAPYEMSILNVSAMSFGSLSGNAILALNLGAKLGGYAHDTGEGGLSPYHLEHGGDLVWEIGTAYFGCRTPDGGFDGDEFAAKAADDRVKAISLKLSQGAKPGRGGVMPAAKVTVEIARIRDTEPGVKVVSPPSHREFSTPRGMLEFIAHLRELSGGKPTGFKLCLGSRVEFLAVCKAIVETGIEPDFVIVDGSEGGTGAAPLEFMNHVGMPLTEGLITAHNALVGAGLRERIRIGASGKVSSGFQICRRMAQGADFTNAARPMMMAVGCIQAMTCHTNTCPVGVATQDPVRARALNVSDKGRRAASFQAETVRSAQMIAASQGRDHPRDLTPDRLMRRVGQERVKSLAEIYDWLEPGELLVDPPAGWARDWETASAELFAAA